MKYLKGLFVLTLALSGCQLLSGIQGAPQDDGYITQFTVNEANPSVGKPIAMTVKGDLINKDYSLNKVAIQVSDELKLIAVRVIVNRNKENNAVDLTPYEAKTSFTVNSTGSYQIIGTTGEATAAINVLQ